MRLLFTMMLCALVMYASAQGKYLLQLNFDGCTTTDISGLNMAVNTIGSPACVCSPSGDALKFNGTGDALSIQDSLLRFAQAFSVSLVFRPDSDLDNQRIASYKQDCNSIQGFDISYHGSTNSITFELFESLAKRVFIEQKLDDKKCWHTVTFVKAGSNYIVYLYGENVFQTQASSSFDVGQNGTYYLGTGPCVPTFANGFDGAISYASVYDEVLPVVDIENQVVQTDRIITPDALIFLGEMTTPVVDAECATGFLWSPSAGVSDVTLAEPDLSPTETTIYELVIQDGGCQVIDSLRVLVVDPSEVTCEKLILPTAFTPNNDNLNDFYFISNGFVVEELIRFEIFDRWGGTLFSTSDVTMGWDGSHEGEIVMPGVYVFKAEYVCNGETKVQVGSFSVLN